MGSFAERGFLFQLAHELPANAVAVEVGSWIGASTCFLAAGLTGTSPQLKAVDNFRGLSTCAEDVQWHRRFFEKAGCSGTLDLFQSNVGALGFSERVTAVVNDSLAFAGQIATGGVAVDFVFIDGDHSYTACQADIRAWTPLVKTGGVIAFHDFGSRAEGVTRAIFEATKAGAFAEIVGVAGTIIAFRR